MGLWTAAARRAVLLALLVALPLQPLVYYAVRIPLHGALASALGPTAPLTAMARPVT